MDEPPRPAAMEEAINVSTVARDDRPLTPATRDESAPPVVEFPPEDNNRLDFEQLMEEPAGSQPLSGGDGDASVEEGEISDGDEEEEGEDDEANSEDSFDPTLGETVNAEYYGGGGLEMIEDTVADQVSQGSSLSAAGDSAAAASVMAAGSSTSQYSALTDVSSGWCGAFLYR